MRGLGVALDTVGEAVQGPFARQDPREQHTRRWHAVGVRECCVCVLVCTMCAARWRMHAVLRVRAGLYNACCKRCRLHAGCDGST